MNPQQALDDAAELYCIDRTGNCYADPKSFKSGALSPEAMRYWEMNSPQVKALREALEKLTMGCLTTQCDGCGLGITESFDQDIAIHALKAWDEREK